MRPPVCQYDFKVADLRGHGCTLASLAWLAREATDSTAWDDAEAYAARLQKLSGVTLALFRKRGTTITEAKVAYEAAPGFDGRVAPALRLFRGGSVRGDLLPELQDGKWAICAVNYGVVQDANRGVGAFRGGHAIVAGKPANGKVTVADPLRRELVSWPIDLLVKAMETFGTRPWGNGRGEFGVAGPSPTILEFRTQQRDAARRLNIRLDIDLAAQKAQVGLVLEERNNARRAWAASDADLTAAQAQVAALDNALTRAQVRILELEATTAPDCMTAQQRADAAEAIFAQVRAALGLVA